MKTERWFVYCFLENSGEKPLPETGIEGAKINLIPYGEIAAVASPLSVSKGKRAEEEVLRDYMQIYQKVNGSIFRSCTAVPVKFGSMAENEAQIKELLEKTYLQVRAALSSLEGKAEFVILTYWDLQKVFLQIRDEIEAEKSPPPNEDIKIQLGRKVFESVESKKKGIIENIHNRLKPLAIDHSDGKLSSDNMILHRSYLIQRDVEPLFDEAMSALGESFPEYIIMDYVGPMPPYSFVNLKISKGNFGLVEEARKVLGLPMAASFKEIKAAYKKLSFQHHPDKNPNDPHAEERFKKIVDAFQILQAYCWSDREPDENKRHSFRKGDVEKRIIVASRVTA